MNQYEIDNFRFPEGDNFMNEDGFQQFMRFALTDKNNFDPKSQEEAKRIIKKGIGNIQDFGPCNCQAKNGVKCSNDECPNREMYHLCDGDCSEANGKCQNCEAHNSPLKKLHLVPRGNCGIGVAASEYIREGEQIAGYAGKIFIPKNNPFRKKSTYIATLVGETKALVVIDPFLEGNVTRFMQHSKNPNVVAYRMKTKYGILILFYALKPIPPGTELLWDYGPNLKELGIQVCNCREMEYCKDCVRYYDADLTDMPFPEPVDYVNPPPQVLSKEQKAAVDRFAKSVYYPKLYLEQFQEEYTHSAMPTDPNTDLMGTLKAYLQQVKKRKPKIISVRFHKKTGRLIFSSRPPTPQPEYDQCPPESNIEEMAGPCSPSQPKTMSRPPSAASQSTKRSSKASSKSSNSSRPPSAKSSRPPSVNSSRPPSANSSRPPSANSSRPPSANSSRPPSANSSRPPSSNRTRIPSSLGHASPHWIPSPSEIPIPGTPPSNYSRPPSSNCAQLPSASGQSTSSSRASSAVPHLYPIPEEPSPSEELVVELICDESTRSTIKRALGTPSPTADKQPQKRTCTRKTPSPRTASTPTPLSITIEAEVENEPSTSSRTSRRAVRRLPPAPKKGNPVSRMPCRKETHQEDSQEDPCAEISSPPESSRQLRSGRITVPCPPPPRKRQQRKPLPNVPAPPPEPCRQLRSGRQAVPCPPPTRQRQETSARTNMPPPPPSKKSVRPPPPQKRQLRSGTKVDNASDEEPPCPPPQPTLRLRLRNQVPPVQLQSRQLRSRNDTNPQPGSSKAMNKPKQFSKKKPTLVEQLENEVRDLAFYMRKLNERMEQAAVNIPRRPRVGKPPLPMPDWPCYECDQNFNKLDNYKRHLQRQHIQTGGYDCDAVGCDRSFNTQVDLDFHKETHKKPENRVQFQCRDCKKYFTKISSVQRHMTPKKEPGVYKKKSPCSYRRYKRMLGTKHLSYGGKPKTTDSEDSSDPDDHRRSPFRRNRQDSDSD